MHMICSDCIHFRKNQESAWFTFNIDSEHFQIPCHKFFNKLMSVQEVLPVHTEYNVLCFRAKDRKLVGAPSICGFFEKRTFQPELHPLHVEGEESRCFTCANLSFATNFFMDTCKFKQKEKFDMGNINKIKKVVTCDCANVDILVCGYFVKYQGRILDFVRVEEGLRECSYYFPITQAYASHIGETKETSLSLKEVLEVLGKL